MLARRNWSAIIAAAKIPCALIVVMLGLAGVMQSVAARADRPDFDVIPLTLDRGDGTLIALEVEIASTPLQQQYGLMFVTALADNQGMLFVFPKAAMRSFWMKNTLIPLDMLFFDEAGVLVNSIADVPPRTLSARRSIAPARYVLELNGGSMARFGINGVVRLLLPDSLRSN